MLRHRSLNLKNYSFTGFLPLPCLPEPLDSRPATAVLNSGVRSILNRGFLSILNSGFRPILNSEFRPTSALLNSGFLLVNRPPQHFSRIRAFSGQPMDLDPAAGNGLLAALVSCGKQPAVPACPTAEMGMGILPP
jgi:hypothetical protein